MTGSASWSKQESCEMGPLDINIILEVCMFAGKRQRWFG